MSTTEKYFFIDEENLQEAELFSFHLYLFNPANKKYNVFIYANSPLDNEKKKFLKESMDKGARLAVAFSQKRTFLDSMELDPEDVVGLQAKPIHELEQKRLEKLKELNPDLNYNEDSQTGRIEIEDHAPIKTYSLQDGFESCSEKDDFLPMIKAAQSEIQLFSVRISHTVSLAAYLAEHLMETDNLTNRIVACSYFLAKNLDFRDDEALGDLICAAFFHHLGMTQQDFTYCHVPQLELSDKEKKEIQKTPALSQHLLRKSRAELSDRCMKIIFEHHERYDGRGYPNYKRGSFIDPLALVLGAVSHIFEYQAGKVTGKPEKLKMILTNMKNRTFSPGLEFEFGDNIYNNLITLMNTDKVDKAS